MTQNLITKEGLERLHNELHDLKNIHRPSVINDIAEARSHGDLKENSEYVAAKEKQALIEGKINELEQFISIAEPFDPSDISDKNEVRFGAKCKLIGVEIKEVKNLQIVSPFEADLAKGLVAIDAPVAKILLGKRVNSVVEIMSKGKKQEFEISNIEY
jgi:transcription elongation factor GreA